MRTFSFRNGGFSLVEILLVIVITGIIGALILINMSSSTRVDAQVEAKRVVHALYSLRSAWLSYHADKFAMLGVPSYNIATDSGVVAASLDRYIDNRDFGEETKRYGSIDISSIVANNRVERVYLGFNGAGDFGDDDSLKSSVQNILNGDFGSDYGILSKSGDHYAPGGSFMIRIR
ncbi:MAG: type II secretion system GspH family protein [Synergistaceae bacterium]|nr:type II secretion system GspH family protein [Synergistaceae bacterium]